MADWPEEGDEIRAPEEWSLSVWFWMKIKMTF